MDFMIAASFTQLVWQNTQKVGMGVQRRYNSNYDKVYGTEFEVIVLYKPRGNIPGEFKSNVFIPRSMDQGRSSGNK